MKCKFCDSERGVKFAPAFKADVCLDCRQESYGWAQESWSERYAEAGSDFVMAGGFISDANLVASLGAGPKPTLADYGLEPAVTLDPVDGRPLPPFDIDPVDGRPIHTIPMDRPDPDFAGE